MKLVTYDAGHGPRVGLLEGEAIVDVGFEGDMVAFIEAGAPIGERTTVADGRLLAPLRPRSLRDFLTFKGHLDNVMPRLGREIAPEWFDVPAYYKGMPDTVIGPDDEIPWPAYADRLDHELEIAAVIGTSGQGHRRRGRAGVRLRLDDLERHVRPGHADARAPDRHGPRRRPRTGTAPTSSGPASSRPTSSTARTRGCPCGSTARRGARTRRRTCTTRSRDLIAYASQSQTLYPGEVLGSGTAAGGSGMELDRWLEEGDVVELEIEGIGVLRNRIGHKGG